MAMLLAMLAAVARKDYGDRGRRQAQGQAKPKAEGRQTGRQEDAKQNAGIATMLRNGTSWSHIQAHEVQPSGHREVRKTHSPRSH